MNAVDVGGSGLADYSYDGNGNIVSKTLANGTLASYTYDASNRLTTLNHTLAGASFARFDYGYDSVNRRTYEQRNSAAGDVYGYDAIDQVASVNYDAANPTSGTSGTDRTVGYTYDAVGNRTAVNDSVNGNASYTANNDNQYASVAGSTYGYDANGNLNAGANGAFYDYDAQNRLTTAATSLIGGNIDQMSYDSRNRVVSRTVNTTVTYFIYDGWDLIEERSSAGTVLATYVHGARQDELLSKTSTSGTIYYQHNAIGSVTNLTNASGTVVEKYKYDAFGKPAITNGSGGPLTASAYGNRFLFTGREYLAEVNLYDYRNRVFSADLGRFLQTDPLRVSAGDVNIYRYCGNDPLNFADGSGLCPPPSNSQPPPTPPPPTPPTGIPPWLPEPPSPYDSSYSQAPPPDPTAPVDSTPFHTPGLSFDLNGSLSNPGNSNQSDSLTLSLDGGANIGDFNIGGAGSVSFDNGNAASYSASASATYTNPTTGVSVGVQVNASGNFSNSSPVQGGFQITGRVPF